MLTTIKGLANMRLSQLSLHLQMHTGSSEQSLGKLWPLSFGPHQLALGKSWPPVFQGMRTNIGLEDRE